MLKFPEPFFRTTRQTWFVWVAGKQVNLGPDREAALRRYHELMHWRRAFNSAVAAEHVLALLDAFLQWCQKHKSDRTYDRYRLYLESLARAVPPGLTTEKPKPFLIQHIWLRGNVSAARFGG